jgi:hypothetical protein
MLVDMGASPRWIVRILGLAGLLFAGLGLFLLITLAFPRVTCTGDFCLIGPNVLALPALGIDLALEIAAGVGALNIRSARPPTAKN